MLFLVSFSMKIKDVKENRKEDRWGAYFNDIEAEGTAKERNLKIMSVSIIMIEVN